MLCIVFLNTLKLMRTKNENILYLFDKIPVFGNPSIPTTYQYLKLIKSQKLTQFGDVFGVCVSKHSQPNDSQ